MLFHNMEKKDFEDISYVLGGGGFLVSYLLNNCTESTIQKT